MQALDTLLKELTGKPNLFGGKATDFGGDFRQTLYVVCNEKREDLVPYILLYYNI